MAFYTEERLNENRVLTDADFNVGFADYLGATISDAWHDNPTVATIELGEVYTAQVGRDALADLMGDSFDTETNVSDFEPTASPALSLEDQQARIKEAGLEKHIKAQEGYNAEALNLVMESKREELERQVTRQAASDWYAPAGFIAGLGTSMLDPINLASNFIPGVGQTRALRMLQEGAKQGAKGLALRRAAIGAAEGAVGSVVVEPLVALARSQQQADYGMTDSLLNVAFGTVMGATLHPAIGAWGDYKRKQAQKNNPLITAPWEVVPPTDKTEALRHQFAQDALAKAREAGASMTEEQAYASAALFDARARTVAYFENIDPEEYYRRHRPEFEAELERMGELEQGMYRNKADMHTFIQNTMAGMYGKKTFIGIGELSNEAFPGYELQMTDDTVRHVLREEHAGFDDWESVVDVVNTGEAEALDASTRVTGNKVTVYAKQYGDRVQVALVSPRSEKRRELMLLTTFNTTEKGYAQWMEGIKKDPSQTDAYILTGRGGESPQGLPTGYEEPFSESNIPQTDGDINTLLQRAWHGTPHDFDAFTLQAIGSGEGAQAHGWGLYFAQNRDVSEGYRINLIEPEGLVFGDKKYSDLDDASLPSWVSDEIVREQLEGILNGSTSREEAIATLRKALADEEADARSYFDDDYQNTLDEKMEELDEDELADFDEEAFKRKFERDWWGEVGEVRPELGVYSNAIDFLADSDNAFEFRGNRGQLFEVEIPDNDVMLDEQKPFEEQPEKVKAALLEVREKAKAKQEELEAQLEEAKKTATSSFEDQINLKHLEARIANQYEIAIMQLEGKVGDEIYRHLRRWLGSPRAASEALNAVGIKGITYEGYRDGRCFVVFDDKAIQILDKLYQLMEGQTETPRGMVEFNPNDGKAVVTFFKNADASTLPHEMFHIFRRELAETAGMEGASPQSRDMWAKVCEFVGADPEKPWTTEHYSRERLIEMEETFARAGERYLLEGKAPNAQLRGVFERMKQWFMEIYTSVDAAGMEISDTMRQVFGDMFKLSPEEADMAFRYGFGKMLEWDGSEGTDTAIPELPESDDPAMQEELTGLAAQRLEESLQGVADRPDFAEAVRKLVEQEIAELDAEMAQAKIQGDVLLEAALCDMRN